MLVNGKIPDNLLVGIEDGKRLRREAAQAWTAIRREVQRLFGWLPTLSPGWTAYRTFEQQVSLFQSNYTLTNTGRASKIWNGQRWYLRPGKASAATPGRSNHGWGAAVDVAGLGNFNSTKYNQFASVAQRFQFSNAEGKSINEPWHWVFTGKMSEDVPTSPPPPTTETPKYSTTEDDMWIMIEKWYPSRLGRNGSLKEIAGWVDSAVENGWNMSTTLDKLESSKAERATVLAAYQKHLNRKPQERDYQERAGVQSVAEVWSSVAASPEAQARKK